MRARRSIAAGLLGAAAFSTTVGGFAITGSLNKAFAASPVSPPVSRPGQNGQNGNQSGKGQNETVVDGCTIVANPTPTKFTNCPGVDLSGANLSSLDLSFANLSGAQFASVAHGSEQAANLTGANLTDANLSNAAFGAGGVTLNYQGLPFPVAIGATLTDANLSGANLSSANLSQTDLTDATLIGANLTDVTFTLFSTAPFAPEAGGTLTGAKLTDAILTGANFSGTLLVPGDQAVLTLSDAGVVVTWPTPPSLPGATPGTCTPPSGSTFGSVNGASPTVTCQVIDDFGDVATGTFNVSVTVL